MHVSFARKIMHESILRLLASIYRLLDEKVLTLASNIYTRERQELIHAREQVELAREHQLTARGKGVNAREYVLASVKFKSSGTVFLRFLCGTSFGHCSFLQAWI